MPLCGPSVLCGSCLRSSFRACGVDFPVSRGLVQREAPHARLDARLAAANLRHVTRGALAGGDRQFDADADLAGVEGQALRFEAVESALKRLLIPRRPHG